MKTPIPDPRTGGAGETGGEVLGRNHVRMYICKQNVCMVAIYLAAYSISYGIISPVHMCVVSVVLVDVGRSRRRSDDESRSRSRERRQKKASRTDREQSGNIHVYIIYVEFN